MLTDTDHSRVLCSPIDSGMLKRPGTRSNRLGPDPDPADHLKYRPEPIRVPGRVPGPRVSGPGSSVKTSSSDACVCSVFLKC